MHLHFLHKTSYYFQLLQKQKQHTKLFSQVSFRLDNLIKIYCALNFTHSRETGLGAFKRQQDFPE